MINGATEIIGGVPGKHLDPLLLAQSQAPDSVGFIMIAYQSLSVDEGQQPSRFYDLLFFRGPVIFECARLNQDLRFQLHQEVAFQTFKNFGRQEETRVFLFLASDELLYRFRATFYYEPCLKVQVKALSKRQIITLLKSTGCQHGIIECNEFTQITPSIELLEISSSDDIAQYHPKFKNGRILLYDTEKNKELVQERYSAHLKHVAHSVANTTQGNVPKDESVNRPSIHIFDSSRQHPVDPLQSIDEKAAEEFAEFIKKILSSPPPDERVTEPEQKAFLITRTEERSNQDEHSSSEDTQPVSHKQRRAQQSRKGSLDKPKSKQPRSKSEEVIPLKQEKAKSVEATGQEMVATAVAEEVKLSDHHDYIRLFERLFRSFRQQIFDCYGDRSETVIAEAERKVRFLTPEFDLRSLNDETAIVTLDLVETIANDAPFFKKSKLREAALTLVADLYNKQYELLEQHRVIEKVEQFYYRLKR
jgi:hypothetical protein